MINYPYPPSDIKLAIIPKQKKCRVNIPNINSRPPKPYIYKTHYQAVDTKIGGHKNRWTRKPVDTGVK